MPENVPGDEAGDRDQDRLRVLELLQQQKITAAEASELLAALGENDRAPGGRRGRDRNRWLAEELAPAADPAPSFRVRVTDPRTAQMRTNLSGPIGMVGF